MKNSFLINKVYNSYILSGNRGTGKTTIARLLAKTLNCKNLNFNNNKFPCLICNNCILIKNNKFLDLIEIDAASNTKVEEIRELVENSKIPPIIGINKIYIIDEIHVLSKQSFTALLKILEDTPNYLKFILITTNIEKVPYTIISRCMHFSLNNINEKDIKKYISYILKKEKVNFDDDSLNLISEYSNGSMRDALTLINRLLIIINNNININIINKVLNLSNINIALIIIKNLINKKILNILKLLEKYYYINYLNLINQLLIILHNIIMNKINNKFIIKYKLNIENINNININYIQKIYDILLYNKNIINLHPNQRICFEIIILKIFNI
ncbi:DNA polymerase III subunit gamma/tau [endosymbiont of Metamasius hemipterus]|uniref:DNA polymerase III subunit gamma/tau n=1 Tax=endosymbiont of Metamasius hemipterus TaxID=204627 RepID=A0ABT0TWD8_9GAMM|nr:DNA polymerase III subunit gamma/tau [endosymbiont of Metamasius hemipterus]